MVCPWQLFITWQLNASSHQRSTGAAVWVTDGKGLKVGGRGEGLTSRTPPQSSGRGEACVSDEAVSLSGSALIGEVSYTRRQMISVWEASQERNGSSERKGDDLLGEATAARRSSLSGWEPTRGTRTGRGGRPHVRPLPQCQRKPPCTKPPSEAVVQ